MMSLFDSHHSDTIDTNSIMSGIDELIKTVALLREPETYEHFEKVVLTHTCRNLVNLKFGEELIQATKDDILVGEQAQGKLQYYPTTTREKSKKWVELPLC